MLPFVRMLEYGNVAPSAPEIKSVNGWGSGYPLYAVYDNGELYGIGQSYNLFGDGVNVNYTDWHLIRSDISEVYVGYNINMQMMAKTKDGRYLVTNGVAASIFPNKGIAYDVKFVDVTEYMVLPTNTSIKKLYYGGNKIFVIDENDDLFVTGNNGYYSAGLGNLVQANWTKLRSNVKDVAMSPEQYSTWIVTLDNKVFRTGTNTRTTLALNSNTTSELRTFTEYVPSVPVKNVYFCGFKVFFVDINNNVSVFGMMDNSSGNGTSSGTYVFPIFGYTTLTPDAVSIYASTQQFSDTFALNGSTIKYAGTNSSAQGGLDSFTAAPYFTNTTGVTVTNPDNIFITGGNSASYIFDGVKLYGSGYGAYLYGKEEPGTYVSTFVKLKLPRDI